MFYSHSPSRCEPATFQVLSSHVLDSLHWYFRSTALLRPHSGWNVLSCSLNLGLATWFVLAKELLTYVTRAEVWKMLAHLGILFMNSLYLESPHSQATLWTSRMKKWMSNWSLAIIHSCILIANVSLYKKRTPLCHIGREQKYNR